MDTTSRPERDALHAIVVTCGNTFRCFLLPYITCYKFQNHLDKLETIEMYKKRWLNKIDTHTWYKQPFKRMFIYSTNMY